MSDPAANSTQSVNPVKRAFMNASMMGKLTVLVVAMFGFGYAMVPLYKAICEATGINFLTKKENGVEKFVKNTQVDKSRILTIEFDANRHGAWTFKPEKNSIQVHPGELATMNYELVNNLPQSSSGQAIPSYAPMNAGQHFKKLECFCFKQQKLESKEKKIFPVVFVVDPKLPQNITNITLSYTFFEVGKMNSSASAGSQISTQSPGAEPVKVAN